MKTDYKWYPAVSKHVKLALVYAADGATATAAKLLREAADLLEQEYARRQALMNPQKERKENHGRRED